MPNPFFRAKHAWDAGDREAGVSILHDYLRSEIGTKVWSLPPGFAAQPSWPRFEVLISSVMSDEKYLIAPFGRVFSMIWNLHPSGIWVLMLLGYDFGQFSRTYGLDEEVTGPSANLFRFDLIVEALVESGRDGTLGPTDEGPNSGRPSMSLERVAAVPADRWGELKPMLSAGLIGAFANCPADFWDRLAAREPKQVVVRFLHDLFTDFNHPIDVVEMRWRVIIKDHPAYAKAVMTSLERVLTLPVDQAWLADAARYDAGMNGVADGVLWFSNLKAALGSQQFALLRPAG